MRSDVGEAANDLVAEGALYGGVREETIATIGGTEVALPATGTWKNPGIGTAWADIVGIAPEAGRCTTSAPATRLAGTGAATAPEDVYSVG